MTGLTRGQQLARNLDWASSTLLYDDPMRMGAIIAVVDAIDSPKTNIADCSKCGGEDVSISFIDKGAEFKTKIRTEGYVKKYGYLDNNAYISVKDHLFCKCNTCGYAWRRNTLDDVGETK